MEKRIMIQLQSARLERVFLLIWFIACLVIGIGTVHDYGMSIDEPNNQRYAVDTWNAYPSFFGMRFEPAYRSSYEGHGPAFITMAGIFVKVMQRVIPGAFAPDLWHFSYFITFLLCGLCLYWLARHWFGMWTAWGILLLFSTQPLLWGHAFINPKDIPFMAFFTFSIAAGFALVDQLISQASQSSIQKEVIKSFANPWVYLAGLLLGLATSIRILGPYAGVIVVLYGLYKTPRRTLGVLPAYLLVAAVICFVTWPHLWTDPIGRLLQSIHVASAYPWQGGVLFEGRIVPARDLPARYLPEMISIQFTEAAVILFIAGFVLAFTSFLKKQTVVPLALFLVWFVVPFAGIIISGSVVYDGFRQILFLVPPLFLMTGYALEWIFTRLRNLTLRLLLVLLIAVPGIYSIISIHPYQYIYFNSLVGGIRGAHGNYELDYWATSYREAALFLNKTAPPDPRVAVYGPVEIVSPYTRPDIKLNIGAVAKKMKESQNAVFNYAVILNRRNAADNACQNAKTIKTVEREGAVLMIVKEILPGDKDCP
jgi:4-amino-4-deoxy-L-arabinose transferase-like glycosyltransferase